MGAVISIFVEKLMDVGKYFYKLHRDADDERQGLQKELETIQAKLEDAASSKSRGKEEFRVLEKQMRDVVYDAEDLIEDFDSQELAGANKWIRWQFNKMNLAVRLKEFRNNTTQLILKDPNIVNFLGASSTRSDHQTNMTRQKLASTDKTLVGFKDVIETLIENVRKDTKGVEVISITGMAGLGKTTVAWKIFRDSQIQHDFPTRIWIVVSQQYEPRNIYLKILKKLTGSDFSSMDDHDLAKETEDYLSQVKFLLVVDDVWTEEAWNEIKYALPMTKGTGKVLMTCRDDNVAHYAKTHNQPHKLRFLDEAESWELLQYEVYGNTAEWPQESLHIGSRISKKCGGLPLAIVVIGGILRENTDPPELRRGEWSDVSKRTEEYFMGKGKEQENMEKVIELSYNAVPYSLRDCFLYLGVYPNNKEISVWNLTRLWIAEGFIKENNNQSLEKVAVDNLKELIRRNLVMDVKRNRGGEVKKIRVHDTIREFCKKKANDEKLFQLISKPSEKEHDFHRICIHSHALDFLEKKPKGHRTRSFLCFSKHEIDVPPSTLKFIVDGFKRLLILEVSSIKFPKFEPTLFELIHLRYISLAAGENFKSFPKSIASLCSLQTIVIDTSRHTFEIKADVGELRGLRHVKTKAGIIFACRKKVENNNNLQTLNTLSADSCKDGEFLNKTPNIQTLGVCGDLTSLVESTCFKNLNRLTKMKMIKVSERPLVRFLAQENFPPYLQILTLSATNLEWSYTRTLGQLPLLEVLKLKDNAFKGDKWKVNRDEFPKIHYLHIDWCDLSIWTVEDGSLPELATLFLNKCERLLAVPPSLSKTLQTLEMGLVPRSARQSAEQMLKETKTRKCGELKLKIAPGTSP